MVFPVYMLAVRAWCRLRRERGDLQPMVVLTFILSHLLIIQHIFGPCSVVYT